MILYPSITVDLYKPYPLVILEVPQYNIGRGALVTLTAGGAAVVPTDEIIETYALKPDGTKVYNTAILAGNQVQINFSEQMTAVDGILQCELQMTDALGHSITTPIFAVRILPSNIDAKAITSSDDFQALVDALAQVQGFDQVKQSIGTLSELTTTAKDNLVAAINEVDGDIGDLSGLTTTAKNNLVAALNELNQKTNISNGNMNTTFYTTAVWAEGTPSVNFFVAPKTGWYFLAASGTHDSGGTDGEAYQINLRVNGDITVGAGGVISGTMISTYVSTIVHLNKGDIVRPYVHIGEADDSFVFRGQWALLQIG